MGIYGDVNKIGKAYEKLEESGFSGQNKQDLEDFIDHLMAQNLSDHKIYRYLLSFRMMEPEIDFTLRDATRKDLVSLVGKINKNELNSKTYAPESKKEFKKALKKFYKWVERSENPDKLEFMTITIKNSEKKKIDPSKLPSKRQVAELIGHAKNRRDRAMISLLWESGARIGEFLYLDWSDLSWDEDLLRLNLDGKTGHRVVPVKVSIPLIRELREVSDTSGAVFKSLHSGNRLSYKACRKQIDTCAKRADVDCKVNPHAFRKSRATFLASQGANIFQLMELFGWTQAETAKVYVRLAQSNVDQLVKNTASKV